MGSRFTKSFTIHSKISIPLQKVSFTQKITYYAGIYA